MGKKKGLKLAIYMFLLCSTKKLKSKLFKPKIYALVYGLQNYQRHKDF